MTTRLGRWLSRHKAFFAIVVPYVALSIAVVALMGVYDTRADNVQAQADQTDERARELVVEAAREKQQICDALKLARADNDKILLTIAAVLPPRTGQTIVALVAARPPIEC